MGLRSPLIECQNPDARRNVNFQPPAVHNTWPSMALCERRLDPPLQPDLQPRPCFINSSTHKSSTRSSLKNTQFRVVWSGSISWHRQVLSPLKAAECARRRTERILPPNVCSCAIWTCKWVCVFFFFCRSEFAGWSGLWEARKGTLLCIIKCFPLEIRHSFQYWVEKECAQDFTLPARISWRTIFGHKLCPETKR